MWWTGQPQPPGPFQREERSWVSEHGIRALASRTYAASVRGIVRKVGGPQVKQLHVKNCAPPALKTIAACTPAVTIMLVARRAD